MTTKLIIRKPNSKGLCTIFIQYHYKKKSLLLSSAIQVRGQDWNEDTTKIKKTVKHSKEVNQFLTSQVDKINSLALQCKFNNVCPTTDVIKKLYRKNDQSQVVENSFFDVYSSFLDDISNLRCQSTVDIYNRVANLLKNFEKDRLVKISFETINYEFFQKFVSYSIQIPHLNSTIRRNISILKSFLNNCVRNGYTNKTDFRSFKVSTINNEVIYLNKKELKRIEALDVPANLSHIKDLFLLQIFLGLRFSDLKSIKKRAIHYIQGQPVLIINENKTKRIRTIPLLKQAQEILMNSNYKLIQISNVRYNYHIKSLCRLACINTPITVVRYRGSTRIEKTVPKHEVITSHSARRTFVSLSLENKIPIHVLATITHGGNVRSLMRYCKVEDSIKIAELQKAWSS